MDSTSSGRPRMPYSRRDDARIIEYFLNENDPGTLGGNECWKRLEKNKKYNRSGRTWQSLKERFRKAIKPQLPHRYNLTPAEMERLDCGPRANDRILERRRIQARSALDASSDEISDPDEDAPRTRLRELEPPRAEPTASPSNSRLGSTFETSPVHGPRQSTSSIGDGDSILNRSKAPHKRRRFFQHSSPILPEREILTESPKRFARLNDDDSDNESTGPGCRSPRKRKASDDESRRSAEKRLSGGSGVHAPKSRRIAEEESPPEEIDETIPAQNPSREISQSRRKVRFQSESSDEPGESSPIIETAKRGRSHGASIPDKSVGNVEGATSSAGVLTQTEEAISSRTRSSCKVNDAAESPENSAPETIPVESQKKFQKKTSAAILSSRAIKQERDDGSYKAVAPRRADPSTRVSTQDMLRNAVSDTQSDESFHSTFQSPSRTESRDGSSSPQKTQTQKNHESRPERGGNIVERLRSETAHSSTGRRVIKIPRLGSLRIPELSDIRDETLIKFAELIESTFRTHDLWGPHGNCPGLHGFLYFCKLLRERISDAQNASSERKRTADQIDQFLQEFLNVPFCCVNGKTGSLVTAGVHRHFLHASDWMSLLDDLKLVYEIGELQRKMSDSES